MKLSENVKGMAETPTEVDADYLNNIASSIEAMEDMYDELEAELADAHNGNIELMKLIAIKINEAERLRDDNQRLRDAIQNWMDGSYLDGRPDPCPHGRLRWIGCNQCDEAYEKDYLEGVIKDRSK